jgi:Protein of unknown function (DUF4079)
MVELADWLTLLHPAVAIAVVFPLLGIVVNRALQVRQRRQQTTAGASSKIPAVVGAEHVQLGRQLSGAVVGVALLGMAHPIFSKMIAQTAWQKEPFRVGFVAIMFGATIASLAILYRARQRLWRAIFAILTGMGLVILGSQPEVFRRDSSWYVSHYYGGIAVTMLMIFSLAIISDIYQDRQNRWRTVHIVLNCVALLFFLGQGITGSRDLLEIPLTWQNSYIRTLHEQQCKTKPCVIQAAPAQP